MNHSRFVVMCVLSLLLTVGDVPSLPAGEPASTTKPAPLARFPGMVNDVRREFDGSAVCVTSEGVFLAEGDLRRWSAVPSLPRTPLIRLVGGDRDRFFIEDLRGDTYSLQAVEGSRKVATVRQNVPQENVAAFTSKNVGVLGWSNDIAAPGGGVASIQHNLLLTTDGGATWNPVSLPLVEKELERISTLVWTSPSRLLVGGTRGSAQLLERQSNGTFRQVWSAAVPGTIVRFALDGDYVWAESYSLNRLKLTDGHLDATFKPGVVVKGMVGCHNALVMWDSGAVGATFHRGLDGFKSMKELLDNDAKQATKNSPCIHIWMRDPEKGYVRRAKIPAGHLAGVLPLESPLCLVIPSEGGVAMLLDLDKFKLSNTALQVIPLPPPPDDPNLPTLEQEKTMFALAARVPLRDRIGIFQDSMKQTDLTGRQKIDWLTEQFRHYIETKKPGPVNLAEELAEQEKNNATPEQMTTMHRLYMQLPRTEANALTAESAKKGLSDRQRFDWLIEQYRQYLEHHKPTPEKKKQPDEKKAAEESPGRKPAGSDE